jgi:uncharacterized protein with von Willebrand factor type A (vWA) domain
MITGLSRFVTLLRRDGIAASPAEWLDAVRALELVGIDDREVVRTALGCTLVKQADQRQIFERAFDRFFAPPRGRSKRRSSTASPGSGRGPARGAESGERPGKRAGERRNSDASERQGPDVSERLRHALRQTRGRQRPRFAEDEHAPHPLHRRLDRRLTGEDERELAAWVPRLVEQIRLRSGRRLRKSARGRLYLRRVFRENLARGGVPFVLPRRRIQPRRSKVTLFIDVSWSTATAAGLFLSVAGEFLRRRRETRVLLFVDRAIDATAAIRTWLARRDAPSSFATLLRSLDGLNLDAPSDYGRAFHGLLRSHLRPAGRNAMLLVLGDGRTNRFDPQTWAFEEIADRCGVVLWLAPEDRGRWGSADSALEAYLAHVDVAVEARDLAGLARGVSELVRRL